MRKLIGFVILGWIALMSVCASSEAAANIKFALHGDSLTAYLHSGAGKTGVSYTPLNYFAPAASEADATAIGGSRLTFDTAQNDIRGWVWPGFSNASLTGKYSVLIRVKFPAVPSGTLANNTFLFAISGFVGLGANQVAGVGLSLNTDSTLRVHLWDYRGQQIFANSSFGSWSPSTGVWYDVVLTWDGSTSANKVKCYIDGVSLGTKTATSTAADANGNFMQAIIGLGYSIVSGYRGDSYVNEFVIWDDEIDPTSGGLNLSGASRSSFVSTSGLVLDPNTSTDPGVANVLSTAGAYTINGVSKTPTYVAVGASNVKTGVTFGAGSASTGSYDGSDRWTCPSAGDLRSTASALKCNSTSTNLTGTLVVPTLANTKIGVSGDGGTGTYDGSDRWTCPSSAGRLYSGDQLKCNSTSLNFTGTLNPVTNVFCQATLSSQNQVTDGNRLYITQGDTATLQLLAEDGNGSGLNLTGATFSSYILGPNGKRVNIGNSYHTAAADQTADAGEFSIALTAAQTALLAPGSERELVTKVTIGSSVTTFHGRKLLTILPAYPVR